MGGWDERILCSMEDKNWTLGLLNSIYISKTLIDYGCEEKTEFSKERFSHIFD